MFKKIFKDPALYRQMVYFDSLKLKTKNPFMKFKIDIIHKGCFISNRFYNFNKKNVIKLFEKFDPDYKIADSIMNNIKG